MLATLKALLPDRHPLRLLWHRGKALAAALRFAFPARSLTIIGITGTDGKTTTVAMTADILKRAGWSVGAVSTTFLRIGDTVEWNATHKTSLPPFALQQFLRRCVNAGCTHVVVEASSHGLVQTRLDFLWPLVVAITNTSEEHLDYHGTMEQYRADKGILFRMLRPRGAKVLNRDDGTYHTYAPLPSLRTITYFAKPFEAAGGPKSSPSVPAPSHEELVWITDAATTENGTAGTLHASGENTVQRLVLKVPGAFNMENALCALGIARGLDIPLTTALDALKEYRSLPGRLERIDEGQPFSVYVDFTVTPAAYDRTLTTLKGMLAPGGRLLVLTGSCGNRMPEKRPAIGRLCSELADVVVVTEDETITEDPLKVIDEVWAGIDQSKTSARKITDRREAIAFLLEEARIGDIVALCGMGACSSMQTREGLRPWDEREVAREILRTM